MPTYSMLTTLAIFMLPTTISKLVAENKNRSIKILQNATFLIMFINIFIISIMILSSSFIATTLLNEPSTKYIIIAMSLTLPFISLSSIIKGYFLGKQQTLPYMVSNILEQILRLIIIFLVLPTLVRYSALHAVIGLMLLTIISETFSVIVFLFFLPKKINITKNDLTYNKDIKNDLLNLSLPTVSSKVIGNIGYFFEPIILTNLLIYSGYTSNYVITEYANFNAYAIPILTIPAFFIQAVSQTLVPEISKHIALNNIKRVKKIIKRITFLTLLMGISFSIFIFIFNKELLSILYNTTNGSSYIKILAPVFSIFYLEGILYSILHAIGKQKEAFKITCMGVIIKLIILSFLSLLHIGLYSLVIAEIVNIIYVTYSAFICIKNPLFKK